MSSPPVPVGSCVPRRPGGGPPPGLRDQSPCSTWGRDIASSAQVELETSPPAKSGRAAAEPESSACECWILVFL